MKHFCIDTVMMQSFLIDKSVNSVDPDQTAPEGWLVGCVEA